MDAPNAPLARVPSKKAFPLSLLDFKEGPGNLQYEGIRYEKPAQVAPVPTPSATIPAATPTPVRVANSPRPRSNIKARKTEVPDDQLCTLCNTGFAAGTHLAHLATHIPVGSYFCPFCSQNFGTLAIHHLSVHSDDRPFECLVVDCAHAYKKQTHLDKHMASTHGSDGGAGHTVSETPAGGQEKKKISEDSEAEPASIDKGPGRYPGDNDEDEMSPGHYSIVTGAWIGGEYGHKLGGPGGK